MIINNNIKVTLVDSSIEDCYKLIFYVEDLVDMYGVLEQFTSKYTDAIIDVLASLDIIQDHFYIDQTKYAYYNVTMLDDESFVKAKLLL